MTGELAEINAIDLFQLINSSQKTGIIELTLQKGKAMVFFKEGEIIYARFLKFRQKDAVYALLGRRRVVSVTREGFPTRPEICRPSAALWD